MSFGLATLYTEDGRTQAIINELMVLTRQIMKDEKIEEYASTDKIVPLKETRIINLLKYLLDKGL